MRDIKGIIILSILIFLSILVGGVFPFVYNPHHIYVFFGCILGLILILVLTKNSSNKYFKKIYNIAATLIAILAFIMELGRPVLLLFTLLASLYMITYAFPMALIMLINSFLEIGLATSTIQFISLCISTMTITVFSESLLKLVFPFIVRLIKIKKGATSYKKWLSLFYKKENVIFVIYLLYFVFLSISSYYEIQYGIPFFNKETDKVILKSFLVYIAFTSLINKLQSVQLKLTEVLKYFFLIIMFSQKDNYILHEKDPDKDNSPSNSEN